MIRIERKSIGNQPIKLCECPANVLAGILKNIGNQTVFLYTTEVKSDILEKGYPLDAKEILPVQGMDTALWGACLPGKSSVVVWLLITK